MSSFVLYPPTASNAGLRVRPSAKAAPPTPRSAVGVLTRDSCAPCAIRGCSGGPRVSTRKEIINPNSKGNASAICTSSDFYTSLKPLPHFFPPYISTPQRSHRVSSRFKKSCNEVPQTCHYPPLSPLALRRLFPTILRSSLVR